MLGYCVRNAFATASATFTSTDVYHTTLPSLAAAATSSGVVSCACASSASMTMTAANSERDNVSDIETSSELPRQREYCFSARQPATALWRESYPDARACCQIELRRGHDQELLADIDDV